MLQRNTLLAAIATVLVLSQSSIADDKQPRLDEPQFVKTAISAGLMKVELGKLGNTKALRPDIKQFAAKIETDHAVLNKELAKLAETMKVEAPKKMLAKHEEAIAFLTNYNGKNFDRDYMTYMIKGHETDMGEFRRVSRDAKNADLKQFATKTLPALEEHLKLAKALQEKVDK